MASLFVTVFVDFLDAAGRTATVGYMLDTQYDSATMDLTAVQDRADELITALNVLTMDRVNGHRICIAYDGAGAAPNVAANNQVRAFSRVLDTVGRKTSFEVPAWDDVVFAQDDHNLLSPAYNTAAGVVADMLRNAEHEDHDQIASLSWSQSRTRKSRNVVS